jgi:APA family basic amino acid/polyamine antiporter
MVGAGVFVSTGSVAQDTAGPAVNLSYIVAGFACVLSALCYAEYACDYPIAGGAFNFITLTFGEFAGWLIACNLFIEWTLVSVFIDL